MERTGVIIVAGGSGSRAGGARPKQFRFLGGMPVLARTINTFAAALPGAEIVVVLPADYIYFPNSTSGSGKTSRRVSMSPNTKSPREARSGSTR